MTPRWWGAARQGASHGVRLGLLSSLLMAGPLETQTHDSHHHDDEHAEAAHASMLCLICPPTRDASRTSWQPDGTATTHRRHMAGPWRVHTHARPAGVYTHEGGPRGDGGVFSVSHAAVSATRSAGAGVFGLQSMWSLDPANGRRGYPLLGQTGETADGVPPLIDRQHPHDLPIELAATYARQLDGRRSFYLYGAAVGAPALGPPPFMHRQSGSSLPAAPMTHHWLDASHVTYGVVTAGLVTSPAAKIEASGFRGREPDQDRWGLEVPALDSSPPASRSTPPGLWPCR